MKLFCAIRCLCLFVVLFACGCTTQTIKFYDGRKLPDRQVATLAFPLSVDLEIDGKDVVGNTGGLAVTRQVKLLPDTYDIQWRRSGRDYTFVYEGRGVLTVETGERYEIKFDTQLGATRLTGTSVGYKHFSSEVVDYATWIENTKTKEVLVGRKLQMLGANSLFELQILFASACAAYEKGDYESAINYYRRVLKIKPDFMQALNNLAWMLATSEDESVRDPAWAVGCARKACELSNYSSPVMIDTLAIAYAANGDLSEAQEMGRKALKAAKMQDMPELADEIERHLELIESNM
jgi:tetratricopeptide (TPR) repeat protein